MDIRRSVGGPAMMVLVVAVLMGMFPSAGSSTSAGSWGVDSQSGFVWPISPQPVVVTDFAPPANRYGAGHRGVDLAGSEATTIRAAGTGVVIFAGTLVDRGVISIEHAGGLRTTYEPVTALISKGVRVSAGQVIGTLQIGHQSCTPAVCLHWGAKIGDEYLNPLDLLGPLQVRLKPWDGLADTPP